MNAHKLIEFLNECPPLNAGKVNFLMGFDSLIESINNSVKFSYNEELISLSPDECKNYAKKVKLPYELCYFEFKDSSILAREVSDEVIVFNVFQKYRKNEFLVAHPKMITIIDKKHGLIRPIGDIELFYNAQKDEFMHELLSSIPGFMCRFLSALNCSNTCLLDNKPPIKLQKSRIKKGKIKLFEYKTLHIDINNINVKKQYGGGHHASPRIHLRRGHIRKLKNENIWIDPCVVGSKNIGMIHKDYIVTA